MSEQSKSDELGSMASLLTAVARTGPSALAEGTVVGGQYRIERPLGEGGMGVVYLARDTRLDRDVAVKLGNAVSSSALRRIGREAQALARFSHPNVVVVYQVGEVDGRVFIAMEHVDGGTARDWLAARPRTWREIIALYTAAGDGLAAAHAAGLVHRDFKPDNVLVGADGRPRVADFGLARPAEGDSSPDRRRSAEEATQTTQTGAVVGTPAYMPPEQLAGDDVDARADQFAFAAALWEGLFRARPFGVREPAPRVPRHIVAALRRALEPERDDRWPELPELLAELRRDPGARRRRIAMAAGGLAVVAAASAGAMMLAGGGKGATPGASCDDGEQLLSTVWNPQRRGVLAVKVGEPAWTAIATRVEARSEQWLTQWEATCRAARIDHTLSGALLDRRMLCLEERKAQLDQVLRALELAGRDAAIDAPRLLDSLPLPETCARPELASDEELPPVDAESQRAVVEAVVPFAAAEAAALDPTVLDPLKRADEALAAAEAARWRPLIARAHALRGHVLYELDRFEDARAEYDQAAQLALASRSDHNAVVMLADSAWPLAELARLGEAKRALDTARSMWTRTGEPASTGQRLYSAIAHVALYDDRPHDAVAATRQQIALSRLTYGDAAWSASANELNLSIALEATGNHPDAAAAAARAIEHGLRAYGAHPTVAKIYAHDSWIAAKAGDLDQALRQGETALAIFERWYGPDDHRLVASLQAIGEVHRLRGDLDRAVGFMQRALDLARKHDAASIEIPKWETNLAILAAGRGDFAEAERRGTAALEALERIYGPEAEDLINALVLVGYVARHKTPPDLATSLRHLERAHELARKKHGEKHGDTLNTSIELSHTLVAMDRTSEALALLLPWLDRLDGPQLGAPQPSELRFALAEALAGSGNTRWACALAREAEAGYRKIEQAPLADQIVEWRKHSCR